MVCTIMQQADVEPRFFDVPTFFGRDLRVFHQFADLWYGDSSKLDKSASLMKVCLGATTFETDIG